MKIAHVFSLLPYLEVQDPIILADITLTKDISFINTLGGQFLREIGLIWHNEIIKTPTVGHKIVRFESDYKKNLQQNMNDLHVQINLFVDCLWFVKDNSVYCSQEFGTVINEPLSSLNATHFTHYTTCEGEYQSTIFKAGEFREASRYLRVLIERSKIKQPLIDESELLKNPLNPNERHILRGSGGVTYDYNDYNKIERALNFVSLARSTYLIYRKISYLICVFETLFGLGEKDNIGYRVAQRAALFIGSTIDERLFICGTISKAYDLRSAYFHGSAIPHKHKDIEKQIALSKDMHDLCRTTLKKVILYDADLFLSDIEEQRRYFTHMTLRG